MDINGPGTPGPGTPSAAGSESSLPRLLPQQPHTNEDLSVEVVGKDPMAIGIDARVLFCRRMNDCMPVFHINSTLCKALLDSGKQCGTLMPGETFELSRTWHLPLLMVRGTYTLLLQFHRIHPGKAPASKYARPYEPLGCGLEKMTSEVTEVEPSIQESFRGMREISTAAESFQLPGELREWMKLMQKAVVKIEMSTASQEAMMKDLHKAVNGLTPAPPHELPPPLPNIVEKRLRKSSVCS
eukprot:Skav232014  [mRNA]  locus=scaffold3320:47360:51953:- [translate_table: standard]